MYLQHLWNEFSTLGVALGLLGVFSLFRKNIPMGCLLAFASLGHTAFFIRTWWDTAWGFLPSFVIFALWIGYGLHTCLACLVTLYERHHLHLPRVAVYTVLFGAIAVTLGQSLVRHSPVVNQATNYTTEIYGKVLLEELPPEAILFCEYAWFPLQYLQQVERQRPDLSVILQGEVFSPTHFSLISTQRYPHVQQVTSNKPITVSTVDYFWLLSELNEKHHSLFWDPDAQYQKDFSEYLLPQGLLFSFHPSQKQTLTPADLRTHWQSLSRATNRILQGELEDSTTYTLSHKLDIIASYFRRLGELSEASKMYQAALSMRPDDEGINNNYGALLMAQGDLSKALEYFNSAYSRNPIVPMINKNLGIFMSRVGDAPQAAYFFERAIDFGNHEGDVYVKLSEAYTKLGRSSATLQALQAALQNYQERTAVNNADKRLSEKISEVQTRLDHLEKQLQTGAQTR
jgi:Tfp pilus assembly protein PilF